MEKYIIAIIVGYLVGSINPAYFIGKLNGFDIRERGTGNAGASNIKTQLGWKAFFFVAVYDALKAFICMMVVYYLYPEDMVLRVLIGCAAVLGHLFPFYLNFKGGKGFATCIGIGFAFNWKLFLIIFVVSLVLAFITNWIVTATFTYMAALPIVSIISHEHYLIIISFLIISLIMFYKHIPNINRVLNDGEVGINGKLVKLKRD